MIRIRNALLITALLAVSAPALAAQPSDGPSSADVREARTRFQRGVELYRQGSLDAALAEFDKAYRLAPNYRLLYNIATLQVERHDPVAALQRFREYLEQGGDEISADRRAAVEREITTLTATVAELRVTANVEGAELVIDDVVVASLPLQEPVMVNAGSRRVLVRRPGYSSEARALTVAGGEAADLSFRLQPIGAAPSASSATRMPGQSTDGMRSDASGARSAPARTERRESGSNPGLWISAVTTGALAAGAVTFGFLTRSADADLDRELDRFPGDPRRIGNQRSELRRDAWITDGLTAGAVVAASFTVYFALRGRPSTESTETARNLVTVDFGPRSLLARYSF